MAVLNTDDAAHLLRRAGFGGTMAQIQALVGQDRATVVEAMLNAAPEPSIAPVGGVNANNWEQFMALTQWWYSRMLATAAPLVEKMTLFWHGHFCSAHDKVNDAVLLYRQNQTFRDNALGNFGALTHAVGRDPAMLLYLDNDPNVKGRQNENFARELWELFTLGVGNYTQDEVVASARAWTGHGVSEGKGTPTYLYTDARHDHGTKTIFGVSADWDGDEVLDLTLTNGAKGLTLGVDRQVVAARFIARKLWAYFAYPNPDPSIVDGLASVFVSSGWDVKAVVRTILNHDAFYSSNAKQGLVRSPVEFMVACMKYSGISAGDAHPEWYAQQMGQQLFNPPDVSGWKSNSYWISAASFWAKANFVRNLTWKANTAKSLPDTKSLTVPMAVQALLDRFAVTNVTAATRGALESWLSAERAPKGWAEQPNLFTLVMLTPDFQLA